MLENRLRAGWWPLLWAALVGVALWTRPPLPVDETRYLSVAWEMWQGKQLLVPHINGMPYSQKPPLLFWLIQAGWWLFGVNDWSARLTAPLFGFGSLLLTRRAGRLLWPEDIGLARTLPFVLLGMVVWSTFGTMTLFDMPLVLFCLTAWLGLLRAGQGHGFRAWLLVGCGTGLGLLVKGPVVLLYVVPPAVSAPWWNSTRPAAWPRWYLALLAALAGGIMLALCWALPAAHAGGPAYAHAILLGQTAGRVVHSFAHARPWFWYLLWLPPLLFPWIFWPPVWRGANRLQLDPGTRFCLSALVPAFLLLSLVSGKQVHYLLPLLPAAALLAARAAGAAASASAADLRPLAAILAVAGLALLIIPRLHLQGGDADMLVFLPPWLGAIPLAGALIYLFLGAGPTRRLLPRVAGVNVLLLIGCHLALAGPLHSLYGQEEIGAALHRAEQAGHRVAVSPARLTDQFRYAGRLETMLLPMGSLEEVVLWAMKNPAQECLFFVPAEGIAGLRGDGTATRYKEGWLVVRSAAGLHDDYLRWQVPAAGRK